MKRPKNHEVSERNKYWEADAKGLTIRTDNGPQFKIKSDRNIHFFIYQEIKPHGSLGCKTPNEYDEYSRGIGCEKGAINRVVVVKK